MDSVLWTFRGNHTPPRPCDRAWPTGHGLIQPAACGHCQGLSGLCIFKALLKSRKRSVA